MRIDRPQPSRTRRLWLGAVAVALALGASGCAGYRLGPTNGEVAGNRSIEVRPFANETLEPRLIEPVTQALRRQVQQDGTYRLATATGGDIVITGTLVSYIRNPLTLQPGDVFSTRDYEVRLTARVRVVDRDSGRVVVDRDVMGRTTVRSVADLNSAERQAAPLVAEELARNILTQVVDGTW